MLLGFDPQINFALAEQLKGNFIVFFWVICEFKTKKVIFIFCVKVEIRRNKKNVFLDFLGELFLVFCLFSSIVGDRFVYDFLSSSSHSCGGI